MASNHVRLNQRRLHNVRLYLEKVRGRAPKTLTLAEGEQVQGRARVKFLGGRQDDGHLECWTRPKTCTPDHAMELGN